MTRFASIGTIQSLIQDTAVADLPAFMRDVEHLSPLAVLVLTKQIEMAMGVKPGRALVKAILAELAASQSAGLITDCPATRFKPKPPVLTVGEFRMIMSRFDLMERKLIVFALGTRMSVVEAAALKRAEAKRLANIRSWSSEIRQLLRSLPANLGCPFLFWKVHASGQATHMLDFESKFKITTKASWAVFAALCENIVLVDSYADGDEFRQEFALSALQQN